MTHCIVTPRNTKDELLTGLELFCTRQRFVCLRGCVARLAALIAQEPYRPVADYEASVRHIVAEHCSVHEAGDAIPVDLHRMVFDVRSLMREMERLRQEQFGQATDALAHLAPTPLMAG